MTEKIKTETPENQENMIVEELITPQGYLRVPKAVKDKFGLSQNYPNPKWEAVLNEQHDTLKIIYTINVSQIKKNEKVENEEKIEEVE